VNAQPAFTARQSRIDASVRRALIAAARAVRRNAHAPYSRFRVGAAVWDESDRVHTGCNVENASYGLTVCAERNAIAAAIGAGAKHIRAIAVASPTRPPATPCGACRQVLAEFGDAHTLVVLAPPTGTATDRRLGALLPESFGLR
jgi:cytidine deaminase